MKEDEQFFHKPRRESHYLRCIRFVVKALLSTMNLSIRYSYFVFLLILSVVALSDAGKVSFTKNGKPCIGSCKNRTNGMFCLTAETDKLSFEVYSSSCTEGTQHHPQYFTSQYRGNRSLCDGACDSYGYSYTWCFTGDDGEWDYCSREEGSSALSGLNCCNLCSKNSSKSYYSCSVKRQNEIDSMFCSPNPVNTSILEDTIVLEKKVRSKRSNPREDEDEVRRKGVSRLAGDLQRRYTIHYRDRDASSPVKLYVTSSPQATISSPFSLNIWGLRLTRVITANITYEHVKNAQKAKRNIPKEIKNRWESGYQAVRGDEKGHLLAHSLGGPSEGFNFVPQLRSTNRGGRNVCQWFSNERKILNFLKHDCNNRRYVKWTVIVFYDLEKSRRPTGFGLLSEFFEHGNQIKNLRIDCYVSNSRN